MASDRARKAGASGLTPAQSARVEALRAKHQTDEARAAETRVREAVQRERSASGKLRTTGDGTTMGDLVTFRRFIMLLRRERERLGLSLADVAERAEIDKAALSRLENGQHLNPTVNTLARYAQALGKRITFGLSDPLKNAGREPSAPDLQVAIGLEATEDRMLSAAR